MNQRRQTNEKNINNEESDILDSYEQGQWSPAKNRKREIKKLQQYAQNTLRKDKRINIRMSSKDLDLVRVMATQQGIPYQTLISSIIHKYVLGYLKEKETT
jgi:predicted DNA binding CopG/RHH family protein